MFLHLISQQQNSGAMGYRGRPVVEALDCRHSVPKSRLGWEHLNSEGSLGFRDSVLTERGED